MLGLTRKCIHAIEAVADIAGRESSDPVQMVDLAERLDLSRRYLEPVLQRLVRADVLKGVRGPKGGYRLSRPRYELSVGDILTALGPEETETATFNSQIGREGIAPILDEIQEKVHHQLARLTFDIICEKAKSAAKEEPPGPPDFVI